MAENSQISWTDNTFNPWIGCMKVSPGCANCYAERDWDKRRHVAQWGPVGTRIVTSEQNWKKPLRWNKQAVAAGTRIKVFCASLADVFEDWPGGMRNSAGVELWSRGDGCWTEAPSPAQNADAILGGYRAIKITEVRRKLFTLIDQTPHLDWLLVTKRPENIMAMWPNRPCGSAKVCSRGDGIVCAADSCDLETGVMAATHRPNVWLLTSVENQEQADKRIPELLKYRDLAPVLGLSCEPLLGPLEFSNVSNRSDGVDRLGKKALSGIDWVIAGGESGPGARPMHPDWARSLRDQCQAAGVPFHFKQWGEYVEIDGSNCLDDGPIGRQYNGPDIRWINLKGEVHEYREGKLKGCSVWGEASLIARPGAKKAGRLLDGREWNEFPQVQS